MPLIGGPSQPRPANAFVGGDTRAGDIHQSGENQLFVALTAGELEGIGRERERIGGLATEKRVVRQGAERHRPPAALTERRGDFETFGQVLAGAWIVASSELGESEIDKGVRHAAVHPELAERREGSAQALGRSLRIAFLP